MKILGQKLEIEPDELAEITKVQDRAFEMVRTHLLGPLGKIESLGYTRIELACAYLSLAYHALRADKSEETANRTFQILAYLARQRMETNFAHRRKTKFN